MGQHEIEDLVSTSIGVIDKAGSRIDDRLARSLIANLYRYQSRFHCGITYRRVRHVLMARRYLLELPLRRHPDAARFPAIFDHIEQAGAWCSLHEAMREGATGLYAFSPRGNKPSDSRVAWGANECSAVDKAARRRFTVSSCAGAYYDPPHLLCETGSELWVRLVEEGTLAGEDAIAPATLAPHEVAATIVTEAELQGDVGAIALWYPLLPVLVARVGEPKDIAGLFEDSVVQTTLSVVERTRAYERRSSYGFLRVPAEPMPGDRSSAPPELFAFARAWFALDWSLPPFRDGPTVLREVEKSARADLERGELPGVVLARSVESLGELASRMRLLIFFRNVFGYPLPLADLLLDEVVGWSSGTPLVDVPGANVKVVPRPTISSRAGAQTLQRVTEELRTAVTEGEPAGTALARAVEELGDLVDHRLLRFLFLRAFGYTHTESTELLSLVDWTSGRPRVDVPRANQMIVVRTTTRGS